MNKYKKELKLIGITVILFLLLFTYDIIPLTILGINQNSLSQTSLIIYKFSMDIIFLTALFFLYRKTIIRDFKNFFKDFGNNFEYAFKYWLIGFIIMIISNLALTFIFEQGISNNEEGIRETIKIAPLYMAFAISIFAPLSEELIFRKSFKDIFKTKYLFIIISGLIFGYLHIASSMTSLTSLLYLIPYGALGIVFSSLYAKTDNIFSTIIMHSMHNTMALVLYFLGGLV